MSPYPLGQTLPAEVLVGGASAWARYRQYPVFSAPWLRGRSLVAAAVIGLVASIVGFGVGATTREVGLGLQAGGHLFVAFLLMATTGPALATMVRHRRWPLRRERTAVVLAVLLGMVASLFADSWASNAMEQKVGSALVRQGAAAENKPDVDPAVRPLALAVNVAVLAVVYGLFGGGLSLRAYFSEGRRWSENQRQMELHALRAQKQQSDLHLGLLQAQVEPHFLFNTLASVRALVSQDPRQAEATLDALVDHLRATIPRLRDGDAPLHSTLGQQLDICASYLELMRLRTGGRLSHAVYAAPALRELEFPPLMLITLVENAIKHGIEPQPGAGHVEVRAATRGGQLVVSVVDDGAGLQPGLGTGVGLANVRAQLAQRHGDQAALTLRNLAGRGVVAEIALPLEPSA